MTTQTIPTNPHTSGRSFHGKLTSAHRMSIAHIQDLAINVSLQTDRYVTVRYSGHVHELDVYVVPYANNVPGNYQPELHLMVYLPPSFERDLDALKRLGEIIEHLQGLLPRQGGDA